MSGSRNGSRDAGREARSRAALVVAYREGLGLAPVTAIHDATGIRLVVDEAVGNAPASTTLARWWCRRAADAEHVAAAATALLQRRASRDGTVERRPALGDAAQAIAAAAKRHHIALYSDDEVAVDAERIIARVEQEIEVLKQAGGMKSINRSYKSYRLDASGRGEKVLPYTQWLDKYRQNLLRELASALRYR
jgi:hypothetical protein